MNTAAALNLSALERDGLLPESDYAQVASQITIALAAMRVPSIRCGLNFVAHDYDKYEQKAKEDFDRSNRPVIDPELAFDMGVVPVTFMTSINLSFFPEFLRQYHTPDVLNRLITEFGEEGYAILPPGQFPALLLAGHQIEQETKKRFKGCAVAKDLSEAVEVEVEWLLPPKLLVEEQDDLKISLTIFIFCDD